jgi:syntaxin 5
MSDDRTSEFMSLARSLPQTTPQEGTSSTSSTTAPHATGRYAKTPTPSSDLRAFHKTAADISKDIAATSAMLTELTQLVRNKSLFEQDSSNINTLVVRIKSNIENLNSRLDQAAVVLQQEKRRVNTQAGQEATNLVGQLKEEFVQATAGFKKVLQQRTDAMKETSDAKQLVYGASSSEQYLNLDSKPPVYHSAPSSASQLQQYMSLDLTSGMMAAGESTSSTPQLPRPGTKIQIFFVFARQLL